MVNLVYEQRWWLHDSGRSLDLLEWDFSLFEREIRGKTGTPSLPIMVRNPAK
jgi:hypothetical protein